MTKGQTYALGIGLVAVGAVAAYFLLQGAGDADKDLTLAMTGNPAACAITTSATDKDVLVGKNKKITWHVKNTCTSDQLVLVGNFRPTQPDGGIADCKAGIIESTWPFKNLDQSVRQVYVPVGETQLLTLKVAKNETTTRVSFWFDICMAGKKVDPRLDVDP